MSRISRPQWLDSETMTWQAAPLKGVWRKRFESQAAESGPVTSIVRYDAGAVFSAHAHPLGEEIFVLEGVFADDHGAYPVGTYLRHPPGSRHRPASPEGCVIFVKLNQFHPDDARYCIQDTHQGPWLAGLTDGISVMPLHQFAGESTALVRLQAGVFYQQAAARLALPFAQGAPADSADWMQAGTEILILQGRLTDADGVRGAGSWVRWPAGVDLLLDSPSGCTLLIKQRCAAADSHCRVNC